MRHLFIDDGELTRVDRLYRRVHQPVKQGAQPVITGDTAWEERASIYGTTLFDQERGLFQRWYLSSPGDNTDRIEVRGQSLPGNVTLLAYATSRDGEHWDKPDLGQVSIDGDRHNNILDIGRLNCEGAAIIDDPAEEDPQRRYKALYWEHGGDGTLTKLPSGQVLFGSGEGDGMWISHSPDGVHWTNYANNPAIGLGSDTDQSVLWDPVRHCYAAYGRFGAGGRKIARSESLDFVHWTEPRLVFACDQGDEYETQCYGMPLDLYEGLFIGVPWIYRPGVDGTIDTQLAVSRDGSNWQRVGARETFLPLGEPGAWDDGMVRVGKRFIVRDEEVLLYYGAVHGPHGGRKFDAAGTVANGIGLARLRRDGFVSLRADADGGSLLTRPVTVDGAGLYLNVDAAAGAAQVTVCDLDARPIERWARSAVLAGDATAAPVSWPNNVAATSARSGDSADNANPANGAGLAALRGTQVRLLIRLTAADLYSFWFAD